MVLPKFSTHKHNIIHTITLCKINANTMNNRAAPVYSNRFHFHHLHIYQKYYHLIIFGLKTALHIQFGMPKWLSMHF